MNFNPLQAMLQNMGQPDNKLTIIFHLIQKSLDKEFLD